MWLLLVPIVIFAAMILASVVAGLFWVVGQAWPLLLIGLGVWLMWRDDGRHRLHGRQLAWATASRARPGSFDRGTQPARPARAEKKATAAPARPKEVVPPELPIDVQVKVEQIRRKVDVLLSYADRFPPCSQDLYLVQQTASDYLPGTLSTYLSMPRETAEKTIAGSGKTARDELKDQLSLLDSKLDDIAQDLERQDTDRLLANRRFLEQRFGLRGNGEKPTDVEANRLPAL